MYATLTCNRVQSVFVVLKCFKNSYNDFLTFSQIKEVLNSFYLFLPYSNGKKEKDFLIGFHSCVFLWYRFIEEISVEVAKCVVKPMNIFPCLTKVEFYIH